MAAELGVSSSTISRLFSGNGSFEAIAQQAWEKLYPNTSSHEQQNQLIAFIKQALKELDEIELTGGFELNKSSANLTYEFLKLRGLSNAQGRPTDAFYDWLSERRTLQAKEKKEDDDEYSAGIHHLADDSSLSQTSPNSAKGTQDFAAHADAASHFKEERRQQEAYLNKQPEGSAVGASNEPVNHVKKICYMGPIKVLQGHGDALDIVLDVNLGEESKELGDLVVTAGFEKLRVKVRLENFMEVRSHHRDGKLRGRMTIQNEGEVFVVEETCFGKPAPFLKDTVFEGEALYSARIAEGKEPPKVGVTCFIAFSDFELDVFDTDGERLSDFTERQQNLRKLALKEFIKTRCRTQGFEGTVSEAEWVDDVEA